MVNTDDILKKYGARIERQMGGYNSGIGSRESGVGKKYSKSYDEFRNDMMPEFSRYERWCKSMGSLFRIKVGEKDKLRIDRAIEIAHLNVDASEVLVFSTMLLFLTLFGGIMATVGGWMMFGNGKFETFPIMLTFLIFLFGIFLFFYSSKTPERLAMKWRLKASSQMVPAILYIV
ncbi:MAG: hypothetical protein KJ592_03305, partial [Nanoarchaeota archaeon]|nr:hypothetical protein [Nanoarchaeota archaeon]